MMCLCNASLTVTLDDIICVPRILVNRWSIEMPESAIMMIIIITMKMDDE
jgi:hypothetical protein